jgi:hypothetical protein
VSYWLSVARRYGLVATIEASEASLGLLCTYKSVSCAYDDPHLELLALFSARLSSLSIISDHSPHCN